MIKKEISTWFWPVQLGSWALVGLVNFLIQFYGGGFSSAIAWLNLFGMFAGGLLVTSLFRYYFKRRGFNFHLTGGKLIGFLLIAAGSQTVCWIGLIMLASWPLAEKIHVRMLPIPLNAVPLFFIVLLWNLIYLVYHLMRRFHITEVEKWQLEAEVQRAQLGALKSQVNPHFLFNALNNIRSLILQDPQIARQMITRFSEILRYSLQHNDEKEVAVADELDIVRQYLELIKLQYEDKLSYKVSTDDASLNSTIPPMIIQLLVENAVKHGIALCQAGGIIEISLVTEECKLLLTVTNSGSLQVKNELEDNLGIGLKNITDRLRLLYGESANLIISEAPPVVIVKIVIEKV